MNSALRGGRVELGLWLRIAGKAGYYVSTRDVTNGQKGLEGLVPIETNNRLWESDRQPRNLPEIDKRAKYKRIS
jgi:hypothetical protein